MDAKWVIPPVISSMFFMFCYGLFCNIEFYYEKTFFVMVASVCGAVLNVVLNWICIPVFGYMAAAYTTLACYLIFMLAHYLFARRIFKREVKAEFPYKMKDMAGSIVIMVFAMVFIALSYNGGIYRIFIGIAGIIVFLIFKNRIIKSIMDLMEMRKKE